MEPSKKTVEDYEDYLRGSIDLLFLTYIKNGGEESRRIVNQLLKNIHRFTPYLEDLKGAIVDVLPSLPADKQELLKRLIEPLDQKFSVEDDEETRKRNGDRDGSQKD